MLRPMKPVIETVTITAPGLDAETRAALEEETAAFARARLAEEEARDAATLEGVAEFERGEFITAEEWAAKLEAREARVAKKHGL